MICVVVIEDRERERKKKKSKKGEEKEEEEETAAENTVKCIKCKKDAYVKCNSLIKFYRNCIVLHALCVMCSTLS